MNATQEKKAAAILEQAIDEFGLSNALDVLEGLCYEKAAHVRASYGDGKLAASWGLVGADLGNAAGKAMRRGL